MASSDPDKLMSKADKLTKLSFTRWSSDWKSATGLFEQAAIGYRTRKDYEKAKEAFEKASKGQEMISSPWDAARHMESAAALAKDLNRWNEVSDLYRRASELYMECGRSQPASDALAKGARALEDVQPDEAIRLYIDACGILEEDGKEQMTFDLYRAATSIYIKLEKYIDAATSLLRWAVAADACNAVNSQCKAYLSAIIVYLYLHDFKQAQKCYDDCTEIAAFLSSDQNRCAGKLLSAYGGGDVEEIKRIVQSTTISHLDHATVQSSLEMASKSLIIICSLLLALIFSCNAARVLLEDSPKEEHPALPKLELPPLPELPKPELPPLPEIPHELPKPELPPLPEIPHDLPKLEIPQLPEIPHDLPKPELPPLPEIPHELPKPELPETPHLKPDEHYHP